MKNKYIRFISYLITSLYLLGTLMLLSADFSGKIIEWIIPFKEGGGSANWSRFYAPLLSAALPGQTTVVVGNNAAGGWVGYARRGDIVNSLFMGTISDNVVVISYYASTLNINTADSTEGTRAQTTSALQTPITTGSVGEVYESWDIAVWDFGSATQYPMLKNLPLTDRNSAQQSECCQTAAECHIQRCYHHKRKKFAHCLNVRELCKFVTNLCCETLKNKIFTTQ